MERIKQIKTTKNLNCEKSTYHTFVDFSLTVYSLQLLAFWLQILLFLTLLLHFLYIQAQLLVWLVLDPLCKQEWFIYSKAVLKTYTNINSILL